MMKTHSLFAVFLLVISGCSKPEPQEIIVKHQIEIPAMDAWAARMERASKVRKIVLAIAVYESENKRFPSQIAAKDGRPGLSWRVAILKHLDAKYSDLYSRFRLDEPWDSAHNLALAGEMPEEYASIDLPPNETRYLAVVGSDTVIDKSATEGITIRQIGDGISKTAVIIEANKSVVWTKPEDFEYAKATSFKGVNADGYFYLGFCDGHAESYSDDIDPSVLKPYFTRSAGD